MSSIQRVILNVCSSEPVYLDQVRNAQILSNLHSPELTLSLLLDLHHEIPDGETCLVPSSRLGALAFQGKKVHLSQPIFITSPFSSSVILEFRVEKIVPSDDCKWSLEEFRAQQGTEILIRVPKLPPPTLNLPETRGPRGVMFTGPGATTSHLDQYLSSNYLRELKGREVTRVWVPQLFLTARTVDDPAQALAALLKSMNGKPNSVLVLDAAGFLGTGTDADPNSKAAVYCLEALGEWLDCRDSLKTFLVLSSIQPLQHPKLERALEVRYKAMGGSISDDATAENAAPLGKVSLIGMDQEISRFNDLFVFPLQNLRHLQDWGLTCPKGALVMGPTGSGKTAMLQAMAQRVQEACAETVSIKIVDAHSLVTREVGGSEKNVKALFTEARRLAPTLVVIDHFDAIASPRSMNSAESDVSKDRLLSTLLIEMDGIGTTTNNPVLILAAAEQLSALDPAVYRSGRLDYHINLRLPSQEQLLANFKLLSSPSNEFVGNLSTSVATTCIQTEERIRSYREAMDDVEASISRLNDNEMKVSRVKTHADVKNKVQEAVALLTL